MSFGLLPWHESVSVGCVCRLATCLYVRWFRMDSSSSVCSFRFSLCLAVRAAARVGLNFCRCGACARAAAPPVAAAAQAPGGRPALPGSCSVRCGGARVEPRILCALCTPWSSVCPSCAAALCAHGAFAAWVPRACWPGASRFIWFDRVRLVLCVLWFRVEPRVLCVNMFLCLRCAWRRARASGWLALLATEFAVRADTIVRLRGAPCMAVVHGRSLPSIRLGRAKGPQKEIGLWLK